MNKKELHIWQALLPVGFLVVLLACNIFYKEGVLLGDYSNQIILLLAGVVGLSIGYINKVSFQSILKEVKKSLKGVLVPIVILCLVGALVGTWLVSGIIPAMVYYGLQVLSPSIFLPASIIIAIIISIATGSSWTTSATVGVALIAIGSTLGIPKGMIAGAVISGAYFGDKMSPLSDTTNLASAISGAGLFNHIRYMLITTVPTIIITLIVFFIISLNIDVQGVTNVSHLVNGIGNTFTITPNLFIVPTVVIVLILFRIKALLALSAGIILAAIFAFVYQYEILKQIAPSVIDAIIKFIFSDVQITSEYKELNDLFSSGGIKGMISTILLIICAMVFGGIMDAIGALSKITKLFLSITSTVFGVFASTVLSCLGLNIIASDQYLAVVIPGKMFKKAFEDKQLAPENLSRTLEDSGTVTSALIPWNTCGAYQSSVLGVGVADYFIYAIFNWLSPFVTLLFAAFRVKIKEIKLK